MLLLVGCRLSGAQPLVVGGSSCGLAVDASGRYTLPDLATFPSMAAVRLPVLPGYAASPTAAQLLRTRLRHEHRIEVPIVAWEESLWARVSAAVYNTAADYEALAAALDGIRQGTDAGSGKDAEAVSLPNVLSSLSDQHRVSDMTDELVGFGVDEEESVEGEGFKGHERSSAGKDLDRSSGGEDDKGGHDEEVDILSSPRKFSAQDYCGS